MNFLLRRNGANGKVLSKVIIVLSKRLSNSSGRLSSEVAKRSAK
jgi:hypothetical protein